MAYYSFSLARGRGKARGVGAGSEIHFYNMDVEIIKLNGMATGNGVSLKCLVLFVSAKTVRGCATVSQRLLQSR